MGKISFVERRFEFYGGELVARFAAPIRAAGGEFQCHFSIGWPAGDQVGFASGLDGLQALMLAMREVHSELIDHDAYRAGRLTWCEQADLDLPPTWSVGPLYSSPPPPRER